MTLLRRATNTPEAGPRTGAGPPGADPDDHRAVPTY